MTDLYEKYILLFISKHYGITKNRETIYHRKHTVSPEIIIFYKGNMLMEFQTKLLHGKAVDNYANGSTVPPVSLANAFAYESSEQLEKVFQNRAPGFAYTRIANPTVDAFERRVNELEGGIGGVACSSGMSAVTLSLLNILQAGDEVIRCFGKRKYFVKSKTMRKEKTEMAVELYCRQNDMDFMEKIRSIEDVEDVTLIQYNGEYHG